MEDPTPHSDTIATQGRDTPLALDNTLRWRTPFNLEIEQNVVGALLVRNDLYAKVAEIIGPQHFADPLMGEIFSAIGEGIERGLNVKPFTLRGRFDNKVLAGICANPLPPEYAADWARGVREHADRRDLIDACQNGILAAADLKSDEQPIKVLAGVQHALTAIQDTMGMESATHAVSTSVGGVVEAIERQWREGVSPGIGTGIERLDAIMGRMQPQDMVVIAGRPAMGKSALALCLAKHIAKQGQPAVFFSLEMSEDATIQRLLAMETGISTIDQRNAHAALEQHHIRKLAEAADYIRTLPLYIIDKPRLKVQQMEMMAREIKQRHGQLALACVDYLQLASAGDHYRGNKTAEITEISRDIKMMAKALDCPVLALSQLSRAVEQREDKRPFMADLRESGAIEQDADIVAFCYRDEYYLERAEPQRRADESDEKFSERRMHWHDAIEQARGKADIIIGKNRMGVTGVAKVAFNGPSGRFLDIYEGPGA